MKIKSIEKIKEDKDIYCLEVDNENHELVVQCFSGKNYRIGNCNFGLIYGMHWTTFQVHGEVNGFELTDKEAQDYCEAFFNTYPGLKAIVEGSKNLFMYGKEMTITRYIKYKNGSLNKLEKQVPFFTVCKTLLGRKLAVDTDRKLMNYPVQGSGADAIKLGICKIGYDTRNLQTTYKTINLIHDDSVGDSKLYDFDINSKLFREGLEFAINYILRYKFYTPVNQDFCVLSIGGDKVFIEEALTLSDIEQKLIEKMKEKYEDLQKELEENRKIEKTIELNKLNKILQKVKVSKKKGENYDTTCN